MPLVIFDSVSDLFKISYWIESFQYFGPLRLLLHIGIGSIECLEDDWVVLLLLGRWITLAGLPTRHLRWFLWGTSTGLRLSLCKRASISHRVFSWCCLAFVFVSKSEVMRGLHGLWIRFGVSIARWSLWSSHLVDWHWYWGADGLGGTRLNCNTHFICGPWHGEDSTAWRARWMSSIHLGHLRAILHLSASAFTSNLLMCCFYCSLVIVHYMYFVLF